ncbi:MAG: helix-turn-helix domain-containing protein [Candidatus Sulfotelmatobacter sp.]|jgi:DNA-binding transcriptional ArsR family regulator
MKISVGLRAVSNESRLQILTWLKDPTGNFPPQIDGDLVKDGVCGLLIARKLGVSQPTVSEHLRILSQAKLLEGKRIKKWTFYKRNEKGIEELKKILSARL